MLDTTELRTLARWCQVRGLRFLPLGTDAARSVTHTTRVLGQSPQSLIFGPPQVMAGPGEPGFAGFGARSR